MIKALITFFFALVVAFSAASECNNYNNNCLSCIQFAKEDSVHTCTFCPVDGICHAVGSIFNKCENDECISLSAASSCEKKTAADCNAYTQHYMRH